MSKKRAYQSYSREFKAEAVALSDTARLQRAGGGSIAGYSQ